jgi:hypothetical protein
MTRGTGRLTLAALALVCTLPVAASYFAYYVWPPQDRVNYGELIPPARLPDGELAGLAGQPPLTRAALNGRWTLVYAGPGGCDAGCEHALYALRQSRLAQGKEMARVERLWLVTGDAEPPPRVLGGHDGLRVARADPSWLASLPAAGQDPQLFLVDPLGNAMMRFPQQADIRLVIKDLQRLLKYSPLGRG